MSAATAVLCDGSTAPIAVMRLPGEIVDMRLLANPDVVEVRDQLGVVLARRNDRGELVLSTIGAEHPLLCAHRRGETK